MSGVSLIGQHLKDSGETSFSNRSKRFDLSRRSRGNLAGIRPKAGYRLFTRATTRFPWACLCLLSPREKVGRRRRRDRGSKSRDKRRIRRGPEDCPLRRGRGFPSSVTFGDSFPLGKLIARVRAPRPVIDPRDLLYSRQFELVILLHITLYLLRNYSVLPFFPAPSRIGIAVFVTFPRKIEAVFVQNG